MNHLNELKASIEQLRAENLQLSLDNEELKQNSRWINFITDALAEADPETLHVRSWNKAAETLYGISAAEAIGRTIAEVTRREYLNITREEVIQKLRRTGHWEGKVREYRKDGTPLDVLASASEILDDKGLLLGYVAINRDITHIQKFETAIERQRKAFRIIAEGACF